MERCHLLAKHCGHILYHLSERSLIHIHVADIDHAGQLILLTQLPCLLGSDLHAGLAIHYDNDCACCTDRFLYFPCEIKESGCVENIDLVSFPLNGNHGSIYGNLTFDFFFIKITYGIAVIDFPHPGGNSGQICHCFCQRRLTASPMSNQSNITNLICCVNIHVFPSILSNTMHLFY